MQKKFMQLRQLLTSLRWLQRRMEWKLLGAFVVFNLGVLAITLWMVVLNRAHFLEIAKGQSLNYAQLVEQDVSALFGRLDQMLESTARIYPRLVLEHPRQAAEMVAEQRLQFPEVRDVVVADAQGRVVESRESQDGIPRPILSQRDYFIRLRDNPNLGLVITDPRQGTITGVWGILMARAMRDSQGQFAGVVVTQLTLQRLDRSFRVIDRRARGTFTLFSNDLKIVARYPERDPAGQLLIGRQLQAKQLPLWLASGAEEGSHRNLSTVDGVDRLFSYRRIAGYGLNVIVGLELEPYLQAWRFNVGVLGALVGLFLLSTNLFCWWLYRSWRSQKRAVHRLSALNQRLDREIFLNQTIINSSPLAIYTRDCAGIVTAWNPAAERLFGWRAEEIVGHPMKNVPQDRSQALRDRVLAGETIMDFESVRLRKGGEAFDLSTTMAPLEDGSGGVSGYLSISTDISSRKAAERQVEFLAYRDVLTGLPNRLLLQDRFVQVTAHADRCRHKVALLFLDLDNFKTINDSLGHSAGDMFLQEIARRLGACVREMDTISRQGGDEFLLVLSDLSGADDVTPVLLKVKESLQTPFAIDGHELVTSASTGVALYPDDGCDFETLFKKADTAMYRAKDGGRNSYRFFDAQMNVEAVELLHIKSGLQRALVQGEFVLHYQPQFDLRTGTMLGVEALLRWQHPEQGWIPPSRFIPIAEDSGLIVPIGEWVLREACRQAMRWRAQGLPPLVMAVNLSAVQFRRSDLRQTVLDALQSSGFEPHLLEMELTESILIGDTEGVLASVRQLKQLGIKLSIDDFGTGYSSLSYLKRFDIDKLKIDQSFVRNLAIDSEDAAIVRAIVQMASSLNLLTIAEGVEDADTLAQLQSFGCDEAQGYYFARPLGAEALAAFMAQHRAKPIR